MFLSDLSIKRPVVASVMMLTLVTLGLFSWRRLPVDMMPDVEIPLRDRGYLDIPRADEALRGATLVWLSRNVRLYEDLACGGPASPMRWRGGSPPRTP